MRPQQIMFLGFTFMVGTMISLTFAGGWLDSTDVGIVNSLVAFRSVKLLGIWTISVPNLDFILTGIGSLLKMDFAFFRGEMVLLQWFFLMTLGAGTLFGLFTIAIVTISSIWRR